MAWTEVLPSGKYRAIYRDKNGKRRSAGTFDHKRRALNAGAAAEAESRSRGGRILMLRTGRGVSGLGSGGRRGKWSPPRWPVRRICWSLI